MHEGKEKIPIYEIHPFTNNDVQVRSKRPDPEERRIQERDGKPGVKSKGRLLL